MRSEDWMCNDGVLWVIRAALHGDSTSLERLLAFRWHFYTLFMSGTVTAQLEADLLRPIFGSDAESCLLLVHVFFFFFFSSSLRTLLWRPGITAVPLLMYVVTPPPPKLGTIFSAVVSNLEYRFSQEINVSLFLIVSIWSLEWMHSALTKGLHGCTGEKKNGRRLKKRKRSWPHGSCPQLSKDINRQNTRTHVKAINPVTGKNIGMPPSVLFLRFLRALHRWNLRQITF